MFHKYIQFGLILGLVLLLGFGNFGYADPSSTPVPGNDTQAATPDASGKTSDNDVMKSYSPRVGEVLEYDLWVKSIIHGGKQTVKVLSKETGPNGTEYHVQCSMRTIGLAYSLTKYSEVEDIILDGEGMYPLRIRREVHQGKSISVEKVEFDYKQGVAIRTYFLDNEKIETSQIKLPGIVQDAVSLQFFLRKGNYQKGANKLYYYENGMIDETSYNVSEKSEPLKLACGSYPAYDKIDHNGGKITVLVGQDTYRIPLVIRVIASFGKVEAKLAKFQ